MRKCKLTTAYAALPDIIRKELPFTPFISLKNCLDKVSHHRESYGKMEAYLKDIGEYLSDIPYVAYYNMDMQNLDVEIGFPVSRALSGREEIQAGIIPAGKVVFCMYRGPHSEMETAYDEMSKWMLNNGHKPVGTVYEHYYNGPGFPESEMLTMIVMPLEE